MPFIVGRNAADYEPTFSVLLSSNTVRTSVKYTGSLRSSYSLIGLASGDSFFLFG